MQCKKTWDAQKLCDVKTAEDRAQRMRKRVGYEV
jgi:hypothetical protein